jgi:eukaryotic-like serine/threonine-protein kinase
MSGSTERPSTTHRLLSESFDGRYHLEALIGRGGMGVVYRALDARLDRLVAVKVLRDTAGADDARFQAEVRTLARFVHPNLVRLLDAGEYHGEPYLVMDLVEGPTLAQRQSSGRLSQAEVANVAVGIASALAYVHTAGIVHRDVKPANVLLDRDGVAHLADFGIARLVDTTGLTAAGSAVGTPAYLAPEQVQGLAVTAAADVYALGLVLLECLTGRRAFEGTPTEVAAARLSRDPNIPPELDPQWRALLQSMTTRDPTMRMTAIEVASSVPDRTQLASVPATGPTTSATPGGEIPSATRQRGETTEALDRSPMALDETRAAVEVDGPRRRGVGRKVPRAPLAGAVIAVALVLVLGLVFGVFAQSPASRQGTRGDQRALTISKSSSTTTAASTTTSTTSTTTSTTTTVPLPSVTSAANGFQSLLEDGAAAGSVAPAAAEQLDNQLEPLLFASSAATGQQQTQQFDQLAMSFYQDVSNGMITGTSTISALSASLGNLATALGISVPTTSTPGPSGPFGGNGGGGGNGFGRGRGDDF